MITLYVLLVLAVSVLGSRDLEEVCPGRRCELRAQSEYSDKLAPEIYDLILGNCKDVEVLKLTPNLNSLSVYNCRSDLNLEVLPPMDDLDDISLIQGHISELKNRQFTKTINLRLLRLAGNFIERLSNETFSNLSNLIYLYLENNSIRDLPEGVFYPLENLYSLDLSNNKISILTENIFSRNRVLRELYLNGNPLTNVAFSIEGSSVAISRLDLGNCGQLRELRLSRNVINLDLRNSGLSNLKINGSTISSIAHFHSKLYSADFHGSVLEDIALKNILCGMESLTWLDLSSSSIRSTSLDFNAPSWPCEFPDLWYLNLSGNALEYIPRRFPLFGYGLTTLDLSHNSLTALSLESFDRMHRWALRSINLEGNRLITFDYQSFSRGLKNLQELTLYDNLFNATFYKDMTKYFGDKELKLVQKRKRRQEARIINSRAK